MDLHGEALVPTRFLLVNIKNHIAYEAQCVRRKGRELGLKLLRPISLTEASSSEALQLRRLLIERLHR